MAKRIDSLNMSSCFAHFPKLINVVSLEAGYLFDILLFLSLISKQDFILYPLRQNFDCNAIWKMRKRYLWFPVTLLYSDGTFSFSVHLLPFINSIISRNWYITLQTHSRSHYLPVPALFWNKKQLSTKRKANIGEIFFNVVLMGPISQNENINLLQSKCILN